MRSEIKHRIREHVEPSILVSVLEVKCFLATVRILRDLDDRLSLRVQRLIEMRSNRRRRGSDSLYARFRSETQVSERISLDSTRSCNTTVALCFDYEPQNCLYPNLRLDITGPLFHCDSIAFAAFLSKDELDRKSWNVSGRLSSRFPRVSWRFVKETVTSVGRPSWPCTRARARLLFHFLLGQTLHARNRSNYDLFWLRVEVQKATLSRVTPLRFMTHTRRPISEEFASPFVREYIKSCAALSLFT